MPELSTATQPVQDTQDAADHTLAFAHHGVHLDDHSGQARGDCPFCGKADKLTIEAATGLWRCFVCGRSGNPLEFVRQLHAASVAASNGWSKELASERGLMDTGTVEAWGACKSVVDGGWLVPGYNTKGELTQLYCRRQVQGSDGAWSNVLLPTPGVWEAGKSHALHVPAGDFDPARQQWWFAEGPWDGMAFWEVARQARREGDTIEVTGNPAASMLSNANVLAVPGCTTWRDEWTQACRGKDVFLLYDNDHPRDNNGTVTMAGADGVRRVAGKLAGVAASVNWIEWGGGGFDATLKNGFDVRDALTRGMR